MNKNEEVIGYRAECDHCPALAYSESLVFVEDWAHRHGKNLVGHAVKITTTRAYTGPIVHHDDVHPTGKGKS